MKRILYIILLTGGLAKSQTIYQTISYNTENILINNHEPTVLTSNNNIVISGQLLSNTSFVVRPTASYSIIIKPTLFTNQMKAQTQPTKIGKAGTTGKITIAQNPVGNTLRVMATGTEITGYTIADNVYGNIYLQNDSVPATTKYNIDVTSLPAGNYTLIVTTPSSPLSAQFIKL